MIVWISINCTGYWDSQKRKSQKFEVLFLGLLSCTCLWNIEGSYLVFEWVKIRKKYVYLFLRFFGVLIFCFLQCKHWMHFKMIFSCWKKIKNKYFCCVVYNNNIIINLLQCIYYGLNSTGSSFYILNIEETFSFYFFSFWFWSYPACVKMFSLPTHRNKLKCIAYNQCWDFIEMMIFTYPPSPLSHCPCPARH